MAQRVTQIIVGIDVSKDRLDLFELESSQSYSIPNQIEAIEQWLQQWVAPIRLAIEPLTALAIVATYHRGQFRSADSFIAFMGMDVRVTDSGQFRGRRKLTKKGDSELRRLLFNAAMQGRRNALWEPYYLGLRERGLSTTAAFVALGRKLARVCFALLQNQTEFNPNSRHKACTAT